MKKFIIPLILCLFTVACQSPEPPKIYLLPPTQKPMPKPKATPPTPPKSEPKVAATPEAKREDEIGRRFRDVAPEDMEPSEQVLRIDR